MYIVKEENEVLVRPLFTIIIIINDSKCITSQMCKTEWPKYTGETGMTQTGMYTCLQPHDVAYSFAL